MCPTELSFRREHRRASTDLVSCKSVKEAIWSIAGTITHYVRLTLCSMAILRTDGVASTEPFLLIGFSF